MGKEKTKVSREGWLTSTKERLSYYLGFNGSVGQSYIMQAYLSTYLLMTGMDVGITAMIMLIVKVIDAVDDMLFGYIVDKVHPERNEKLRKIVGDGRYMPWLRLCFLLMPIAVTLMYRIPADASDFVKIAWFSLTYLLADFGYTILDVPMNAVLTTMTDNSNERDSIMAVRTYWQYMVLGVVVVLSTVLISEQVGMSISNAVLLLSACMVVFILPMILNVKEHNAVGAAAVESASSGKENNVTIKDTLTYLFKNRNLLALCGGYVLSGCFATGTAVSLFTAYYLFGSSLFSLVYSVAAIVPTLVLTIFVPKLAKRFDKFKMMFICTIISVFTGALVYFLGYKNVSLHLVAYIINVIPAGIAGVLYSFLMPNCVEYGKYKTGIDGTGIAFALGTFSYKITTAVAGSLGLLILGLFGWVSVEASSFAELAALGITQPESALQGLWLISAGIPVIGSILSVICRMFYNLTDKDAAIMAKVNNGQMSREEAEKLLSKKY